jgi:plasmid stability protein
VASITIRNLDDALKAELRVRAARNGRSMEEEVRVILRQALAEGPEESPGFGEKGAAPFKTKSLGELIREDFAGTGGLDIDLPPREMGPEPPDFTGLQFAAWDEEKDRSGHKKKNEK